MDIKKIFPMIQKRKRLIIISAAFSLFLLLLCASYILNPQPVNAMMVGFSNLEERTEDVYLEPTISENVKNMLLDDYEQAKERIEGFFDGAFASPVILFVQSSQALEKYAQNNRTGQTYYTYWGNYIVIGPDGFNTDVIAHEMMHNELRTRLKNKNKVPIWFDEGLATLVDYRFNSTSQFEEDYIVAHSKVTRWFEIVGESGLAELIKGLNKGKAFDELYKAIEASR